MSGCRLINHCPSSEPLDPGMTALRLHGLTRIVWPRNKQLEIVFFFEWACSLARPTYNGCVIRFVKT